MVSLTYDPKEDYIMRKLAFALVAAMLLAMAIPSFADDAFTLPGTSTAPVIDGVLDDCYVKLHNFYEVDNFSDAYDPDKTIKGAAYATWDKWGLYVMIEAYYENWGPVTEDRAIDIGLGNAGYVSCLATDGDYDDDTQRFEIGCGIAEEGTQMWKVSGPADLKDSSADQNVFEVAPFEHYCVNDTANKCAWYEFGIPWNFMDRTGTINYDVGTKFIFNYAANVHTTEEYAEGNSHIVEYGGGCWAGSYTDGGVVTLGEYQIVVEDEPETAAPETAAPAAEAAPAPAAEAAPAPAAAPVAETAAPVAAAAPAAAAPAAQTGDVAAIAVLAAVAALGTAVVVSRKH